MAILRHEPFVVDVAHDALTETVLLSRDGTAAGAVSVAMVGAAGTVSFPAPEGLPTGVYEFTAVARNADGESPVSAPATLVIGGKVPTAPSSITFRFGA
jgi:hypothetical protein